jgi:glycosyltransferase involved in cell wall biosynthesis
MKGISIIVCCYNSVNRLQQTLAYLAGQITTNVPGIELIVVDNNSTDKTLTCAQEIWDRLNQPFEAFFFHEPNPGLTHARKKGIENAKYDYLIFCDDDNWLDKTYSETAYTFFESDPELAILGGTGTAVFEQEKPYWFDQFYHGYAVGKQAPQTQYLNSVYGAGMALRKRVIISDQFNVVPLILNDRKGVSLSSGGDAEICLRVRLLGYKILYTDELTFKHFLTHSRLRWAYLKKLHDGFTEAYIPLHIYELVMNGQKIGKFYWLQQSFLNFGRWIKYNIVYFNKIVGNDEGNTEAIRLRGWYILGIDFLRNNFKTNRIYKTILSIKQND